MKYSLAAIGYLVVAALLLAVWITGIASDDGAAAAILAVILWVALLAIFFILAGFEVAYTDLRDKDPEQVRPELRVILREMQSKEEGLYQAKEWCTVLVTVALALLAEWHVEKHYFWKYPLATVRLPFALAFTTVPLIWLAQGPAKRLAARNSEQFLHVTCPATWTALNRLAFIVEKLRLVAPSILLSNLVTVQSKRNLLPSLGAHYMMSLKRFGHANHYISEFVEIEPDGSATFRTRILVYVFAANPAPFKGTVELDAPVRSLNISPQVAFQLNPPGELLRELSPQLQNIWAGGPITGVQPVDIASFKPVVAVSTDPKKRDWEIRLPFDPTNNGQNAFVLIYEIETVSDAGVFKLPRPGQNAVSDFFGRTFDWPSEEYTLCVRLKDTGVCFARLNTDVIFGDAPHHREQERVEAFKKGEGTGSLEVRIPFPLPGGGYKLNWQVWR